jgi:NAD(P)-dependent dehydrogenase (short-subunit alcohol dehydrogenase family)
MARQRVALITGGAKRVGRAIVERLSAAGFAVAFTYNSSSTESTDLARSTGAFAIQADLTRSLESCEHIAHAFSSRFDHLDLLVNNASLYQSATLTDTDLVLTRRLMAIHFESSIWSTCWQKNQC